MQELSEKKEFQGRINTIEGKMRRTENFVTGKELDVLFPLKHTFVDGMYVREIFMPKGSMIMSKIHKHRHPYFVMKGDTSVLTEKGVQRIKAPYNGITERGTKRLLYMHEDTIWITVHATESKDLDIIEEEVIAKTFDDLPFTEIEVESFCNKVINQEEGV